MNNARKIDFGFHVLLGIALFLCLLTDTGPLFVLVAQFFVGIYQVITSITRTTRYHSFDPRIQKMLIIYWFCVGSYAAGWIAIIALAPYSGFSATYLYAAWFIAAYYCYITYRLAYPKYIKSHLDI